MLKALMILYPKDTEKQGNIATKVLGVVNEARKLMAEYEKLIAKIDHISFHEIAQS